MGVFKGLLRKIFFNYDHPWYSKSLYKFSEKYVNFYNNDRNGDIGTNGELFLLRALIKKNSIKTIFDVGANHGEYTSLILESDPNEEIAVHCFEPDPVLAKELSEKFAGHKNVSINAIALDQKEGQATLNVNKDEPGLNSFHVMSEGTIPTEVPATTIDSYCSKMGIRQVDLIKIDIEGNEYNALRGAEGLLKQNGARFIQFEYGHAAISARVFLKDIFDFFGQFSYSLYRLKPKGVERMEYAPELEKSPLSNFLATREEILF